MSRYTVLYWRDGTVMTAAGDVREQDVTLTDAARTAGDLTERTGEIVVVRRGLPTEAVPDPYPGPR